MVGSTLVHIVEILGVAAVAHHFWPKGVVSNHYLPTYASLAQNSLCITFLRWFTVLILHNRHTASKMTGRKPTASDTSMGRIRSPRAREGVITEVEVEVVEAMAAADGRQEATEDTRMSTMIDQDIRDMLARDTSPPAWVANGISLQDVNNCWKVGSC